VTGSGSSWDELNLIGMIRTVSKKSRMIGELNQIRKLWKARLLSVDALVALQNRKLQILIKHAYENVPYYRGLFDSAGIAPPDIRTIEDLKRIPTTSKDDLRKAGLASTTAQNTDLPRCVTHQTTGSTGKFFKVYVRRSEERIRRQVEFRSLLAMGIRRSDRLAVLGPVSPHHSRLHQRLGFYRSENISRLLSPEDQVILLKRINPTVLWAYPTVLWGVMHCVDHRLSRIVQPRALITSSEGLDEAMKKRIQTDLGIEMFNFYGALEVGRIAAECKAHEGLHVTADQIILECLDGTRGPGEVVLTGLNAFAMPFIRYRIGDLCMPVAKKCSCGSNFPLIASPIGRVNDMVRLPSGRIMTPIAFSDLLHPVEGKLDRFRVIQESSEHLILQLAFLATPQQDELAKIRSSFASFFQEAIKLDIQVVDSIEDDHVKFKAFISKLAD
jgi:phenylacetate-CoA ligase